MNPLQRVKVRVPPLLVDQVRASDPMAGQQKLLSVVEDGVESVGFDDTLLVMEDPSDKSLFSLLTRRSSEPIRPNPFLQFASVEAVVEPPSDPDRQTNAPLALDSGLTADEIDMVRQVLCEDNNARHINGIAYSFEPVFPIAASLLRTKADLLDIRKTPEVRSSPQLDQQIQSLLQTLNKRSVTVSPISRDRVLTSSRNALISLSSLSRTPLRVLQDEVKRAACILVEEDPDEMKKLGRFPPEVLEAANRTLSTFAYLETPSWRRLLKIVDPSKLNALIPPDPSRDGFVSPTAIQLALATNKPRASGVFKPLKALNVHDSMFDPRLMRATNPEIRSRLMKARSQMERANLALERRRWVDWWRRKNLMRKAEG